MAYLGPASDATHFFRELVTFYQKSVFLISNHCVSKKTVCLHETRMLKDFGLIGMKVKRSFRKCYRTFVGNEFLIILNLVSLCSRVSGVGETELRLCSTLLTLEVLSLKLN